MSCYARTRPAQTNQSNRCHGRRALGVEALEDRQLLATITVTSLSDGPLSASAGDGQISLREAIHAANTDTSVDGSTPGSPGLDQILFEPGLNGTVMLQAGDLNVFAPLQIRGHGHAQSGIDAQSASRIFDVANGTLTLDGLWLRNGRVTGEHNPGGAIRAHGDVTIINSKLTNNETAGLFSHGGAISMEFGVLSLAHSTLSGNRTLGFISRGGAIASTGYVGISASAFFDNSTAGPSSYGGAIAADNMMVYGSSFDQNSTVGPFARGGAIWASGLVTLRQSSTVTNNTTTGQSAGGGAVHASEISLRDSTVSGNSTSGMMSPGGGIYSSAILINDAIVTGNETQGDYSPGGGVSSEDDMLVRSSTVSGNQTLGEHSPGGGLHGLDDVEIENYSAINGNQTLGDSSPGGGVYSAEETSVYDSSVAGNETFGKHSPGGGLWARTATCVVFSQVTTNETWGDSSSGGGVHGVDVDVSESDIVGNKTHGQYASGGGVSAEGQLRVDSGAQIVGNHTYGNYAPGGGVSAHAAYIVRSTVADNRTVGSEAWGGGIASSYLSVRASTVSGNMTGGPSASGGGIAAGLVGAPYNNPQHHILIEESTVAGNSTSGNLAAGGGIYTRDKLSIISSTISGNSTAGNAAHGGGIAPANSETAHLLVRYSTIVENLATGSGAMGGGVISDTTSTLYLTSSIVAENNASEAGPDVFGNVAGLTLDSLIGHNNGTDLQESLLGMTNGNIVGGPLGGAIDPLLGPLADNGGLTKTHASSMLSPVRDAGKDPIPPMWTLDQRGIGYPRVLDGDADGVAIADMGSYEHRLTLTNVAAVFASPTILNGISFALQDIGDFDADNDVGMWSMYFDGSDVGLDGVALSASFVDDDGSILMSVNQPVALPGLGPITYTDIVRFVPTSLGEDTQGSFEIVVEGDAVGLSGPEAAIDAIGRDLNGDLLLSTVGDFVLPVVGDVANEDLLVLDDALWMYFDGSDVGLNGSDNITGVWVEPSTGILMLATEGPFDVGGVSGQAVDLLAFAPDAVGMDTIGSLHAFDAVMFDLPNGTSFNGLHLVETDMIPPDGDFNDDGFYDCLDIDALVAEIAAGGNSAGFDLNLDGDVDLGDRDSWLFEAGNSNLGPLLPYLLGDANLDGFVNGQDFLTWNAHKFTTGNGWCGGDFNADGHTNGQDFLIWNSNKFTSSLPASQPPLFHSPNVVRHSVAKSPTCWIAERVSADGSVEVARTHRAARVMNNCEAERARTLLFGDAGMDRLMGSGGVDFLDGGFWLNPVERWSLLQ